MIGDLFNTLLLAPLLNLLMFLVRVIEAANLPGGALGWSIVALTLLIKLVLWPFTATQIKTMKKTSEIMAKMKPHLEELKKKHKDDKIAFAQAQSALYKEHNFNPAAGCLPSLIPTILIIPLYQVIEAFLNGDKGLERINYFLYDKAWVLDKLPDANYLGLNLASKPADFATSGAVVLLVPFITGLLQFVLSKMMTPVTVKAYPSDSPKEKNEKETAEDMSQAMQTQMMYMMPVMIGFFAFSFPIGLSLYWNVLNIVSIYQQYLITGWGGLETMIRKFFLKKS